MRGTIQVTIDQAGHNGECDELTVRSLTVQGERTMTRATIEETPAGWVARFLDENGTELPDYQGWTFENDHGAAWAALMYGWERASA